MIFCSEWGEKEPWDLAWSHPVQISHSPRCWFTFSSRESDTERQISWDITYMWNLEKGYKWTYLQNTSKVTDVENKLMATRGWGGGGINWEIGTDIYTLLYIKWISNKDLLYSPGNSTQYSVMAYMGKGSKKRGDICICICITDWLCCIPETNTTL